MEANDYFKFIFILLFESVIFLGPVLYTIVKNVKIKNWKTTIGEVKSLELCKENVGKGAYQYYPEIEYEYIVDGFRYVGTKWSFQFTGYQKIEHLNTDISKKIKNDKLNIYYNPINPYESVVVNKINLKNDNRFIILGFFTFSVTIYIFITTYLQK